MKSIRRIPAVAFVLLSVIAASVQAAQPTVEGSCTILDLSEAGKKLPRLILQPTTLGGAAGGTVRVKTAGDKFDLRVDLKDLPAADQAGYVYLTHVLWAVTPDGAFTSLGELESKKGRARIDATVQGPGFGLIVTAEPYFAVSRPSEAVLLSAVVDGKSAKNVGSGDAACALVQGSYYAFNRTEVAVALTVKSDAKTPAELVQARHAFKIAELAGSGPDLESVGARLLEAERAQSAKAGSPTVISSARDTVVAAEAARVQAERAADEAQRTRARRAAEEQEAARLAAEKRAVAEREAARAAAEKQEADKREGARMAREREAHQRELANLAAEHETLKKQIEAEAASRLQTGGAATMSGSIPAPTGDAGDAADVSLAAERSRLQAERFQLEAERAKQKADAEAERARVNAESATLRAQLAEENVTRERQANAGVRAEAEQARREADQAKVDAEIARRQTELSAERARIEVERAQLEAQRKTAESEAALRLQLAAEAARQTATQTEAQHQAELARMRQQFELEMQQRELEQERALLASEKVAQQATIEEGRVALDSERAQIVTQLEADQSRLAAERAEMERVRREKEARLEAEARQAEADRATQLAQGREAIQAELVEKRRAMQQEMEGERARMQAQMQAEMEAERARLRQDFERDSARLAQEAAAAEAQRVAAAEEERRARRERLLGQLTEVLDARDTERGLLVNVAGVSFAAGQHELQPEAREKLARLAGIMLANPSLAATIDGHTDSTGSVDGNQALSEKRALAVRDYLVAQGVPAGSMTAQGFGAGSPIATNDTAAGRRANRRIEVLIAGAAIER